MDVRQSVHSEHAKTLDTIELRKKFLIEQIFTPNQYTMVYSHIDRIVVGGIMPVDGEITFDDGIGKQFGVNYFLERCELGLINIGGPANIVIDGKSYAVGNEEALYVGKGAKALAFSSVDKAKPAKLYYNSAPAHAMFPTRVITQEDAVKAPLGDIATCNKRTICKYLVPEVVETCQLSMGLTRLAEGNNWNSMPTHTHERRIEVYFYFNMADDTIIFHMMGEPHETRHPVMHNSLLYLQSDNLSYLSGSSPPHHSSSCRPCPSCHARVGRDLLQAERVLSV